jgi:hypothetical protein
MLVMAALSKEGKAAMLEVMAGLDSDQKALMVQAMGDMSAADQEALVTMMSALSKEGKAAMLEVMGGLSSEQKALMLQVMGDMSAADQEAFVIMMSAISKAGQKACLSVMKSLDAHQKKVFLNIMGKLNSRDQVRMAMLMEGMTAEEKAAFLVLAANLSPEDLQKLLQEMQKKKMRLYYSYCTGCNPSWQVPYLLEPAHHLCGGPSAARRRPDIKHSTCRSCGDSLPVRPSLRNASSRAQQLRRVLQRAVTAATSAADTASMAATAAVCKVEAGIFQREHIHSASASVARSAPPPAPPLISLPSIRPHVVLKTEDTQNTVDVPSGESAVTTVGKGSAVKEVVLPAQAANTASNTNKTSRRQRHRAEKQRRDKLIETWLKFPVSIGLVNL